MKIKYKPYLLLALLIGNSRIMLNGYEQNIIICSEQMFFAL